jgi:NAD(P)-dependent dehydrogenase (short-subunit alcohol dehydrogenase family)
MNVSSQKSNSAKKVLICGASGDIGSAVTRKAIASGHQVVASGRDYSKLSIFSDNYLLPADHLIISDLSFEKSASQLIGQSSEILDGLDVVINCSGIHKIKTLKDSNFSEINEILNLNVVSSMMLAQAFRDKRIKKNNPSLIFLSSVAGLRGHGGESAYSASKAALIGMTRSIAKELAPQNIRVNSVAPGIVSGLISQKIENQIGTEKYSSLIEAHPLGIGSPEDIAGPIMFLASDDARWITGQTIVVDGGYTAT